MMIPLGLKAVVLNYCNNLGYRFARKHIRRVR